MIIQQLLPVHSWGALLLRGELIFVYSSLVRLAEYLVGANAPLHVADILNPSRQAAYHLPLLLSISTLWKESPAYLSCSSLMRRFGAWTVVRFGFPLTYP